MVALGHFFGSVGESTRGTKELMGSPSHDINRIRLKVTYTMCTNILHVGMYTYTFEMVHKVSGSSSPCMRLASLPGEAMNFCVNELGADPRRKLIKNQSESCRRFG